MLATIMNCIYVSDICRYLGLKTEIFTPFVCGAFTTLYSKDAVEESFAAGKVVFFCRRDRASVFFHRHSYGSSRG